MNKLFGIVLWLFGIAIGLLINGCVMFYNMGWAECSKKFSVEMAKQKNFLNKGNIKQNE